MEQRQVTDVQTLILNLAQKIEREFRPEVFKSKQLQTPQVKSYSPPASDGNSSMKGNLFHKRQKEVNKVPSTRSEAKMRCFNCNGPHSLRECSKPLNQAVVDANKAALAEARLKSSHGVKKTVANINAAP